MSDTRELYQDLILDHGRNPRNFRPMADCEHGSHCHCAEGHNPLCGDKLTLYVRTNDELVEDVSFQGSGCAIFTASSSILTELLRGRRLSEVRELKDRFLAMLTEGNDLVEVGRLGKLAVFAGVKEYPMRVKCATLAWRTLEAALDGSDSTSTE